MWMNSIVCMKLICLFFSAVKNKPYEPTGKYVFILENGAVANNNSRTILRKTCIFINNVTLGHFNLYLIHLRKSYTPQPSGLGLMDTILGFWRYCTEKKHPSPQDTLSTFPCMCRQRVGFFVNFLKAQHNLKIHTKKIWFLSYLLGRQGSSHRRQRVPDHPWRYEELMDFTFSRCIRPPASEGAGVDKSMLLVFSDGSREASWAMTYACW